MKFRPIGRPRALSLALFWIVGVTLSGAPTASEQEDAPVVQQRDRQNDARLPNGKLQRDEILKNEHQQNVKDAGQLVDLAEQLREEIEKGDRYVLSLSAIKKTDEIEKLVKKLRSRLRHDY